MNTSTIPSRPGLRWVRHPLVWTVVGVVVIYGASGALLAFGRAFGPAVAAVAAVASAAAAVLLYILIKRGLGGRSTPELAARGAARELFGGIGVGVAFIATSVGIVALFGGLSFTWSDENPASVLLSVLSFGVAAAVVEEIVFRGLLLQSISLATGRWIALGITAALFGGMHLSNPGATWWSAFAIAVEAGILLGAALFWRRSLWFPIGLHFGWNAVQGLLGIPVSGVSDPGLLVGTSHGPAWLSGGEFGIEASIVPVAIGIVLSALMIAATVAADRRARATGKLTVPAAGARRS